MTKYRKISSIDAEQFDGSDEMVKKYGVQTFGFGKQYLPKHKQDDYMEFFTEINISDWIVTDNHGWCSVIKDSIFRKTYEKVE